MGSKARLQSFRPPSQQLDDTAEQVMLPGASATQLRLRRLGEALQVSPSELYNPANAIAPARGAGINDQLRTGLDQDCEALLHAYRRVSDPAERQRLLTLVQAAAERS